MIITFLIIALFFILPDLYMSLVLMRGAMWWSHLLLWLPAAVALTLLMTMRYGGIGPIKMQIIIGLMLCIALPQILFSVFSLIGRLSFRPYSMAIGNGIGIVVAFFVALTALYGVLFGWKTLSTKEVELSFENLPKEFDGYKIVQLSDLHIGTHGKNTTFIEKIIRRANDEQADLIVFTGDLINLSPKEIVPFEPFLSNLKAKDGILAVLGNHDYCIHAMFGQRPDDIHKAVVPVVLAERNLGWNLLLNEHRIIHRGEGRIALVGVENTGKPPFPEIGDLKKAIAGIPNGTFTILLSHDPSHWRMEVVPKTDIPLTLSGHTHAMQFKIGKWSPSKYLYPEWSGLYEEGPQRLFVSEGLGGSIPFRIGTKPEIIVITLKRSCGG